jgi:tetratricopeptide (TPR) repeat protein
LVATSAWSYPLPQSSRERYERTQAWRAAVEMAEVAVADGRLEDAAAGFSEVIDAARRVDDRGLLFARALEGLAEIRRQQDEFAEAVALYAEAVEVWQRILGPDQPRLAYALKNLAVARIDQDRTDLARDALERALRIYERSSENDSKEAAEVRRLLERLERPTDSPSPSS